MIETKEIIQLIQNNSLETLMKSIPNLDFVDYLNTIILQKGISKSDIIQKTNLQRNYAYQIMDGTRTPSKDKVIQLALSLQCSVLETNRLLTLSNNGFLYAKIRRDALILYALEHHFSVIQCNEKLMNYQLPILN